MEIMNLKSILDLDLRRIFNPKIWLLIVLIPHTLFGALVPLFNSDLDSEQFSSASYGLVNSVILLSIYFFTEGKALSRMTAVVGGSVFVWIMAMIVINPSNNFELSAELAPPFLYKFSFNIELAPPLILWGLLSLSGLLHWNGPQKDEDGDFSEQIDEILV
tara:strand:+ start:1320 stop:1802 length:483 start_codon:yes stop_codon:yes gene_type:complete